MGTLENNERNLELKANIKAILTASKSGLYLSGITKKIQAQHKAEKYVSAEIEQAVRELVASNEVIFKPSFGSTAFDMGSFLLPDAGDSETSTATVRADSAMNQEIKSYAVSVRSSVYVSTIKSHIRSVFGQKKYTADEIENAVKALVDTGVFTFKQSPGLKSFKDGRVTASASCIRESTNRKARQRQRDGLLLLNKSDSFLVDTFLAEDSVIVKSNSKSADAISALSDGRVIKIESLDANQKKCNLTFIPEREAVKDLIERFTEETEKSSLTQKKPVPKDRDELLPFIQRVLSLEVGILKVQERLVRLYFDRSLQKKQLQIKKREALIAEYESAERLLDEATVTLESLALERQVKLSHLNTPPKQDDEGTRAYQRMQQAVQVLQDGDASFRKVAAMGEAFLQSSFGVADSVSKSSEYEQLIKPTLKKYDAIKKSCEAKADHLEGNPEAVEEASEMSLVEEEIKQAETLLNALVRERFICYQSGTVYVKYRNIVPISMFYEYLVSERCYGLKGSGGCYNLYEEELRYKRISDDLKAIIADPEKVKANQRHLYEPVCEMKEQLPQIRVAMGKALECIKTQGNNSDPKVTRKKEKLLSDYDAIRSEYYRQAKSIVSDLVTEREEVEAARKKQEEEARIKQELALQKEREEAEERERKRKKASEDRRIYEQKQRELEEKQQQEQARREEEDRIIQAQKQAFRASVGSATSPIINPENAEDPPVDVESSKRVITNSIASLTLVQRFQTPECEKYLLYFVSDTGERISDERILGKKDTGKETKLAFELKTTEGFSPRKKYYLLIVDFENNTLLGRIEFKINISFANDFGL